MEGLEGQVKGFRFGLDPVGWGPNLGAPWWVFYLVSQEKWQEKRGATRRGGSHGPYSHTAQLMGAGQQLEPQAPPVPVVSWGDALLICGPCLAPAGT